MRWTRKPRVRYYWYLSLLSWAHIILLISKIILCLKHFIRKTVLSGGRLIRVIFMRLKLWTLWRLFLFVWKKKKRRKKMKTFDFSSCQETSFAPITSFIKVHPLRRIISLTVLMKIQPFKTQPLSISRLSKFLRFTASTNCDSRTHYVSIKFSTLLSDRNLIIFLFTSTFQLAFSRVVKNVTL